MIIYINIKQIGKRKDVVDKIPFIYESKPYNLTELIRDTVTICVNDYTNRMVKGEHVLEQGQITDMAMVGKIAFGIIYGEKNPNIQEAIDVAITAFQDGLFRVFINEEEICELDDAISISEEDTVTFIRFTMLAGRMW